MKKTPLLLALSLILAVSLASAAEFDLQKAYSWLAAKSANGSIENSVAATSWAVMAFNGAQLSDNAEEGLEWIFSQQSADYCFPAQLCRNMDTALAAIAMNDMQRLENATQIDEALKNKMIAGSFSGMWALEVSPLSSNIGSGDCKASWQAGSEVREVTEAYDKGKFPACQNSYFLNLDCIQSGLARSYPGLKMSMDCTGIEGSKTISLIYKNSNNYYIISSQEGDKAEVVLNNGCFGTGSGDSSCRKEATLYVGWAASVMGSQIDTNMYLKDTYEPESALDNALLYLATKEDAYLAKLKALQKIGGSFDTNVMTTAAAILALKGDATNYADEITKATDWLKTRQREDGSFGSGTATETAAVLYAAFSGTAVEVPDGNETGHGQPGGTGEISEDCGDGYCDEYAGEDFDTCPDDCEEGGKAAGGKVCIENGLCETDMDETAFNCPADCKCGDDVCDDSEDAESCPDDCGGEKQAPATQCGDGICDADEDETSCPDDCGEVKQTGGGAGKWIIISIIALAILGGGFALYKKWMAKKPQTPFGGPAYTFKPRGPSVPSTMQQKPMAPPSKFTYKPPEKKQDELSKSLDEARKLLGK